ncbi:hypothetical protein [Bacillus badius]|uniref:Phage replication initiation protein n=1 Tax=Bacillus badius TaxID=1455 RepID=A0ABR5APA2_BACBA|nr:hypothetical protein [Bacillus badius]KIL74168.1 Phage replication initiation protein [Bacillus badius]MED4718162.1 hypothetical protein [Bacillus badius]
MQGWIKLHRKILENDLWNDVSTFRLFTLLLLKAAYKDGVKVNGHELKQGQYIRSYRLLAQDLSYKEGRGIKQYSTSTIKRCSAKLIERGMITVDETELGTLFTILNYASYQDSQDFEEETQNGSKNEVEMNQKRSQNNNKNAINKEIPAEAASTALFSPPVQPQDMQARIKQITNCFIAVRNNGFFLKPEEQNAIERVAELDVPIEKLQSWIKDIVETHNQKNPYNKVKSFRYCEPIIAERLREEKSGNVVQFGSKSKKREETLEERFARLEREGKLNFGGD